MNWLKDDAIYLSSLNAEELKEGLLDLTYLVGGSSGNKEADSRKAQLAEHKIYALIDLLVFYAVDGVYTFQYIFKRIVDRILSGLQS